MKPAFTYREAVLVHYCLAMRRGDRLTLPILDKIMAMTDTPFTCREVTECSRALEDVAREADEPQQDPAMPPVFADFLNNELNLSLPALPAGLVEGAAVEYKSRRGRVLQVYGNRARVELAMPDGGTGVRLVAHHNLTRIWE